MTKTTTQKDKKISIKELYQDYGEVSDIFSTEPTKVQKVKYVIFHKLSESDRRIILIYAELQSIRKVAQKLGISAASAWLTISKIKQHIKEEMNGNKK